MLNTYRSKVKFSQFLKQHYHFKTVLNGTSFNKHFGPLISADQMWL